MQSCVGNCFSIAIVVVERRRCMCCLLLLLHCVLGSICTQLLPQISTSSQRHPLHDYIYTCDHLTSVDYAQPMLLCYSYETFRYNFDMIINRIYITVFFNVSSFYYLFSGVSHAVWTMAWQRRTTWIRCDQRLKDDSIALSGYQEVNTLLC